MTQRDPFPPGSLAVVALHLGNLSDVAPRAVEVLRRADLVAAEDTRTAARLLADLKVGARLVSYHDWNEAQRAQVLLERLRRGERIAIVSEAGTPGISDPGYKLVHMARENRLPVFPVPGPCALIAFLSASGLPTDSFAFHGFPPSRSTQRRSLFQRLSDRSETLLFYEAPGRVVAALADAEQAFGDRQCALAREMTKPHEEFLYGTISSVRASLEDRPRVRGEICWGVRGAHGRRQVSERDVAECVEAVSRQARDLQLTARDAARLLAEQTGMSTKDAYAALVGLRRRKDG